MLLEINWKPNNREMRKFGATLVVGFGLIAALMFFRGHRTGAEWVGGIGGGIGILAVAAPARARPFYALWMGFAFVMGTISSSVILFVIFFLVITPVGIVMRLFGRDSLALKAEGKDSFWSDHPPLDDKTYYERLF